MKNYRPRPAPATWEHPLCIACWVERRATHGPVRVVVAEGYKPCCYCHAASADGVHVRANPDDMPCAGAHQTHAR